MRPSPFGLPDDSETIHVLGWRKNVKGVEVKAYLWLFADGSVLLTDEDLDN
jgi:hypothetical protein